MNNKRLIEVAFPLKQASIDSVHEKNVRHGHISTLHIWPARRPLAACRAALIATLLPDPGDEALREELLEKLGGRLVDVSKKKKGADGKTTFIKKEETVGGVLHWGREQEPDMDWFRAKIKEAYGGRAPRVLDPFAGGGAIPLEAMRLGCEVTAQDINPVAWFLLKCTLEYPQKLAGQKRPLPDFILKNEGFMTSFFKTQGLSGPAIRAQIDKLKGHHGGSLFGEDAHPVPIDADLAWHVRAWGQWVLEKAREELAPYYPTVDGKPTVAYLHARTVTCKNCRATLPLLKTRWLCKKDNKRVILTMTSLGHGKGVQFGVETNVPSKGGNAAQGRESDKVLGQGTMSRAGAKCPCCEAIMTMEDIRVEGCAERLGSVITAVVVDGPDGKEYRLPTNEEIEAATISDEALSNLFKEIPYGIPTEPTPKGGNGASRAFSVDGYGFDQWHKLFTQRQLLALGTFVQLTLMAKEPMVDARYSDQWVLALAAFLALGIDRLEERSSSICHYDVSRDTISGTFQGYRLPISWDFAESVPINDFGGSYTNQIDWIARYLEHALLAAHGKTVVQKESAICLKLGEFDLILTDPPYYDAIPYSDLMDFFYVWLRRSLHGLSPEMDEVFKHPLSPKWDHENNDGELIDDASRFEGDANRSKKNYEDGMARAFGACHQALKDDGRLVIVFAHKKPDAWETLVGALIRAGFVVDASWPIQTEMGNRTRALSSAALSSSVWLVCRKRPATAKPGWDNVVLKQMEENIAKRLQEFWKAGIRGPDFVWAATGPAMEAYSQHPVVKKANAPGENMGVEEFLQHVRRMVVDFVVGKVLSMNGEPKDVSMLDDVTTYYLLHRYDFGLAKAPVGPCILYALSCNLDTRDLENRWDLLSSGVVIAQAGEEDDEEDDDGGGTGSDVRLKQWQQRRRKGLGLDAPGGKDIPLIDQLHHLMQLWKAGEVTNVNAYLDERGLTHNPLFHHLLQSVHELADGEEKSILGSISNHVGVQSRKVSRGDQELAPIED